jgi:hypothetical protein
MSLDTTRLGQVAAELMQTLADGYEDSDFDKTELGEVMILAEVKLEDEEGEWTNIAWRCSDDRQWVQRGLLHAALEQERLPGEPVEDDE